MGSGSDDLTVAARLVALALQLRLELGRVLEVELHVGGQHELHHRATELGELARVRVRVRGRGRVRVRVQVIVFFLVRIGARVRVGVRVISMGG